MGETERFDVIVSNPPYIAEEDADDLPPEVRDWEPARALFAGPDGLDVLRELAAGSHRHLREGGLLALEVGLGQASAVVELLAETDAYREPRIARDYTGRERFVLAHAR